MVVTILPSTVKLRDLIRQIRSARTAAEERAIITKGKPSSSKVSALLGKCAARSNANLSVRHEIITLLA